MRDPHAVIRRPALTEKGAALKEQNKYCFEVDPRANKLEVKRAVETLFNVKVTAVHTMAMRGRVTRLGRFAGRTPDWKKAIVTLKEGHTIEFFEGA
uniref:Large ribosomal subunit protein uL23 n=1 Tax=uncultured bacterium Rifle_16ft_4_minimus_752 TaxID=1665163 RepID=A0A0H4TA20_9BACT|nr:50S ribosomal protein L23 [uncultured bacterium Rifle_16ft_4_minimus_752]